MSLEKNFNMSKLRVGVIGAAGGQGGNWTKRLTNWSKFIFDIEVVALADKNPAVEKIASKMNGVAAYTDYKEMLKKANLDIVVIATPHFLHAPMVIAAAEEEINVLVEKPMCITLKQADAMRRAVMMNDIKLAVGFQRRYNPGYIGLKNAIDSGDLGFVFQINGFFRSYRTNMYYETSTRVKDPITGRKHGWRGFWQTEGAGALANQLIHHLDIYQWIAPSPVKSVAANSRIALHNFTETDDNTNAIIEFMDGSMGNIQAGVAYNFGKDTEFGVYGTKGALVHRGNMVDDDGKKVPYLDFRQDKKKPLSDYIPQVLKGDM
ncbi:hypothetical protein GF325_11620, partial [Candidatus Bathyarchaeota archaeon]|nr:hypothetical protein [Candidatus Bathyarchaeota archaeon]